MYRAHCQGVADKVGKLCFGYGNAAPLSAKGIAGADNNRQARLLFKLHRCLKVLYQSRMGHFYSKFSGELLKPSTILGQLYRFDSSSYNLNTKLRKSSRLMQL